MNSLQDFYPEFDSAEIQETIQPLSAFDDELLSYLAVSGAGLRTILSPAAVAQTEEIETYPFQRIIRSLAAAACRPETVNRHAALFENTADISEQLLARAETRLKDTCTRSLVAAVNRASAQGRLHGQSPQARYQHFVTDIWSTTLDEFPALRAGIGHIVRNTAAAFTELCERLEADRRSISDTFGIAPNDVVTSIGQAGGDSHAHGRSVSVLTFASGRRLVYKPRDISGEAAFETIAAYVNGIAGTELPAAGSLVRDGYGYVEYIPAEDVSDVSARFMRSCGALGAVLYLLDARDMHFENIIATRRGPVPVDLETLLHPARVHTGPKPEAEDNAYDTIARSLYGTGILPLVFAGKGEDAGHVDLGFLGGGNQGTAPFKGLTFVDPFTDRIRMVLAAQEAGQRSTVVPEAGEQDVHALAEQMAAGFVQVARAVMRDREGWAGMLRDVAATLRIRYVHNPTALYAQILRMTASAAGMADPETHLALLKRIAIASKTSDRGIVVSELRQMAERDVPYFTVEATGTVLRDPDGADTGARLARTPLSRALDKVTRLEETVVQRQLTLLYSAFCARFPDNHLTGGTVGSPGTNRAGREALTDFAHALADELVATNLPDKFGHLPRTWIGPLASAAAERPWPCGVLGYDLYTGRTGPALALAAAGRLFGEERYADIARQIFSTSADILAGRRYEQRSVQQTGAGAYTGMTGLLFGLHAAGVLLDEPGWTKAAQEAIPLVLDQIARPTPAADVIGGISGTATMIAAIGGPQAEAAVPQLVDMLCDAVEKRQGTWYDQSGFAHGVAGVLHALSVLRPGLPGNTAERADTAVDALLDRLDTFYDEAEKNWFSNIATPERFSTGWCHGAAGISLALAVCVAHTGSARAEQWLDQAVANTLAHGFGRNLTWCHGDLGNHDVLYGIAAARTDERLTAWLARIEDEWLRPDVLTRKLADRRSRYAHTNSLMVGTSGVLLHMVHRLAPKLRISPLSLTIGAA
ncbi:type 2 lanthipeptide synthetase LanM family protein [Streptomyces sp. NPDC093586]|uniref:type 2 lanthipeptide synthetase LanM family protein n=1 Tax=Streptomyces sp. NPDC093586 TaxID=3366042 RepID=UPI0038248950